MYKTAQFIPAVNVGLTKETGIPAPEAPYKAMGNSGIFGEMIAKTSPFLYPIRVNALPKRRINWRIISYEYLRPVIPHSCKYKLDVNQSNL